MNFNKERYVIHFTMLTVQCKLYNKKYVIASPQITNTNFFEFIAVLLFKLFRRQVLFTKRKDNRNCQKVG